MKKLLFALPFLFACKTYDNCRSEAAHAALTERANEANESKIRLVITAQEAAWNEGNLEGFMAGYDKSPATTFIAGSEVTQGWQETLDRYKKNYTNREKMGKLSFQDIRVNVLGEDSALVLGKWIVETATEKPWGYFTLLFKKKPEGWRIVLDHTSSATKK